MDDTCKDCIAAQHGPGSHITRQRFLSLAAVGLAVAALDPIDVLATKKCPYGTMTVTRVVNGKKKRVRVCRPAPKEPTPTPTATPLPDTLRRYAEHDNFQIGASLYYYWDLEMAALLRSEFNLRGVEGVNWSLIEPQPGTLQFENPSVGLYSDEDVQFGQGAGMILRGQNLLWRPWYPKWLLDGQFSRDQLITIIQNHVTSVVTHFKGQITEWVVVNEYYNAFTSNPLLRGLGDEYLDVAFAAARAADLHAILLYNADGNHLRGSLDTLKSLQIVKRLQPKGLIDGIGLEMHLDGSAPPDKDEVVEVMRSYGIPVYVTEFDVNLKNVQGTQQDRFALQGQIYQAMIEAAFESGVCRSFFCFSVVDKYSWLQYPGGQNDPLDPDWASNSNPTPWDANYQPKPAYFALLNVLQKPPPVAPAFPAPPSGLRDAAAAIGVYIGTYLGSPNTALFNQAIALQEQQCNLGGVGLWWDNQEPTQGAVNLSSIDWNISFVDVTSMLALGSPVVGGLPPWLQSGSFSADELRTILQNRIQSVLHYLDGRIPIVVIVDGAWSGDPFWKVLGPTYVDAAFQTARAVNPALKLLYGGFDSYSSAGTGTEGTREIVQRLQAQNLIDGVALSMQLNATNPLDRADLVQTMRSYGIPVYVRDLDVNLKDLSGTQDERFAHQASIYKDVVAGALESGVCHHILLWAISDKTSTEEAIPSLPGYALNSQPALFDDNFQPKPAYNAVLDVLKNPPKPTP